MNFSSSSSSSFYSCFFFFVFGKSMFDFEYHGYSLNGARFSTGVVPRELLSRWPGVDGSTDVRLGVCIPLGVDAPLVFLFTGERKKIISKNFSLLENTLGKTINYTKRMFAIKNEHNL
jgi:hypothetical protein